jgi:uncharacterized protein YukE
MDIKVNYNSLNEISVNVLNQTENLKSLFSDMLGIIDGLDAGWVGPDSENFKTISTTYINNLSSITDELEFIGSYIGIASKVYANNDNKWHEKMKKIGEDEDVYR